MALTNGHATNGLHDDGESMACMSLVLQAPISRRINPSYPVLTCLAKGGYARR